MQPVTLFKTKSSWLSLAILSITLAGCATTPPQSAKSLNDKVYRSYENLMSKESYSFSGNMRFSAEAGEYKNRYDPQEYNDPETSTLEAQKLKLLNDLLASSSVYPQEQQRWMKEGLENPYGASSAYRSKKDKALPVLMASFMNRYYYEFDGVVDLRRGQLSFNPTVGYRASNVHGWIKFPLALDLANHKAYADISALSPIVTDPQYDGQYVVYDYKKLLDKANIDLKPAMTAMRELVLVNPALTNESDYQRLPLTDADKENQAVERIQYKGDYAELLAQYLLYFYVNQDYLKTLVDKNLKSDQPITPKTLLDLEKATTKTDTTPTESGYEAMYRVSDAINDIYAENDAKHNAATETLSAAELAACVALSKEGGRTESEAISDCQAEEAVSDDYIDDHTDVASDATIDVVAPPPAPAKKEPVAKKVPSATTTKSTKAYDPSSFGQGAELLAKFDQYKRSDRLITAKDLQAIVAEQPEAYQALIEHSTDQFKDVEMLKDMNYVSNFALDSQGRLKRAEMIVNMPNFKEIGVKNMKATTVMNIGNYGSARVDQGKLRQAISFEEAANERSLLNLGESVKKLTADPNAESSRSKVDDRSKYWSKTARRDELAKSFWEQGLSFVDVYAALYRYAYISELKNDESQDFNLSTLDTTAKWTAYYYAQEEGYPLTAAQKAAYDKTPEDWPYYDEYLAEDVWYSVSKSEKDAKIKLDLQKLRAQGKTNLQIFETLYTQLDDESQYNKYLNAEELAEHKRFIHTLAEIGVEDLNTKKVDKAKLRPYGESALNRFSSTNYRKVYEAFLN